MPKRLAPGVLRRSPAFAALLTARSVSLVGDGAGNLALIVHVERVRGTGTAVGLLLLVASLPRLLSPLTGIVADRVDRRLVLAAGELGQGLVLAVAVVWLPPLPVLLALLLAKSTITAIAEPAGQSAIPALVDDRDLPSANALLGGARQAGEVLGPLLGGAVVGLAGVRAGLALDTLTFLVTVPLLLLRVPRLRPGADESGGDGTVAGALTEAWAGLSYTVRHPIARALLVGFFLAGLAAADDVALPFLARSLGAGPRGIGSLYAAVGAGLVLGYVLIGRAGGRYAPAAGFVAGGAVAALGNVLTGAAPALAAGVAFQMLRGVGIALFETTLQTLLQRTVSRRHMGRVFANVYGAVHVAACLALLGGGVLLDATSARAVLYASGGVGAAGTVISAFLLEHSCDTAPDDRAG